MVILKDGTKVEATSKPVCMEGQYRFTDLQGQFRTIPLTQIDVRATEEANKSTSPLNPKKAKRVLTNEDIAENPSTSGPPENNGKISAKPLKSSALPARKEPSTPPASDQQAEAYWRKRAGEIRAQMEHVDKAMADLSEKIKSGKSDGLKIGFDTYTAVIEANFGDQMKSLQQVKEKLQQQLDGLEEEARKAGAQPGWLR